MRRRVLVPEVMQTSATDCGPAALKALFAGYGIYLSYGRLREACQTDVDGTSIDTLEEVAGSLGLTVEQHLLPADLALLDSSDALPAIVVVRLPAGARHFVVLWRVHGPILQLMDPSAGRIWVQRRAFLESLYIHEQTVAAADWFDWSHSAAFSTGLVSRMRGLGIEPDLWIDRAHLDASLRIAHTLLDAGKLRRGPEAQEFLDLCAANPDQIPEEYWSARPIASDPEQVSVRGAVLLAASGPHQRAPIESLPPSLAAVRREPPPRVWAPVWAAVRAQGWLVPGAIAMALMTAAVGTVFEALLFRGLLDLARHLPLSGQRLAALAVAVGCAASLLALEWPCAAAVFRLGRHLEVRLRARFLLRIPRLDDRYFQSRLISDMALRAHTLHQLRQLPELIGQLMRLSAALVVTAAAIAWFYPGAALPATLAVLAAVGVPLLFQPALVERDLRFCEIGSALNRFSLDALLGSRAIQAHGAERTIQAVHAAQLGQWADAGLRQQGLFVRVEALQMTLMVAPVVWLVWKHVVPGHTSAGLLLLVYWALSIPSTGRELASIVWSLPALRNTLLRFLEPLDSLEEQQDEAIDTPAAVNGRGVKVDIDDVTAVAGGHVILDRVSLHVAPGEHVAIVGRSGSGKSSLVALLLGWHQPAEGRIAVDDEPLGRAGLGRLRQQTAWIDPEVHLFRNTLFDNLCYGNGDAAAARVSAALDDAGIASLLHRLPDGLQAPLGEGGGLVSGGEGQRVRIGRALARPGVRLAVLDEPGRGVERDERRRILEDLRRHFAQATLFAITHDLSDTLEFDRVLVIDRGRILENGSPRELCEESGSRYRALLEEERAVHRDLWAHPIWRRLQLRKGAIVEANASQRTAWARVGRRDRGAAVEPIGWQERLPPRGDLTSGAERDATEREWMLD
jgi:ABC-type bacteriocin/lantibiotic exporter with double-glycine peptidase domain